MPGLSAISGRRSIGAPILTARSQSANQTIGLVIRRSGSPMQGGRSCSARIGHDNAEAEFVVHFQANPVLENQSGALIFDIEVTASSEFRIWWHPRQDSNLRPSD